MSIDFKKIVREGDLNTSTKWLNCRYCEKISLDQIVELLEGIPELEETVTTLIAESITSHPIKNDLIQSFKNAVLEHVPSRGLSLEGEPVFKKVDVINWMQKQAIQNEMFIFRLNSDFVEDCKELHPNLKWFKTKIKKETQK